MPAVPWKRKLLQWKLDDRGAQKTSQTHGARRMPLRGDFQKRTSACITHGFGQRPVLQCIHETPSTTAYDATAQLSNAKLAHEKVTMIPTFWVKRIRSFASSKLSAAAVPSAATRALSQSRRDSRRTGGSVIDRDSLSCGHLTGVGFT